MTFAALGRLASGGPAPCFERNDRVTTTAVAAPIRPTSKSVSEIAETRVRYGYRRVHVLPRREGWEINGKRVYRLYKEVRPSAAQEGAQAKGKSKVEGRPLRGLPSK